ncbi:MAG TPA: hypothetical protein PKE45_07525, partial [Caldilineaceae bacterium]|nr:hypothetical protein [Caldilineaceae bacterium]
RNGLIDVLTVDLAPNQFNFYDIGDRRHVLNVPVVPQNWTADQEAAFWANARKGLEDVARVYPQPDTEGMPYGNRQWLWNYHWSPVRVDYYWLGDSDDNDDGEPDDNFGDIQDSVDDIREDLNDKRCDGGNANDDDCHPWMGQAMGIVDASLYTGGYGGKATVTCYNPFGDCDRNSAVSTNFDKKLSPVWLQEAIHALEWVDTDSGNHDGDNEHHSRYDEGEWGKDINNCNASLTFRQALLDQVGGVRRVIRLDEKDPKEFSMPAMGTSACDGGLMPKSAMSYAPGQSDNNIFLEPLDYRHTLDWIKNNGLQTANAALANVEQTLRLNGRIDQTNKVTVTMSSILGTEGAELSAPTGGQYHVLMLDAGGQTLHDHSFDLAMEHTHGDANESVTSRFNLRLPFPAGVKTVAIQHDGQVLWAKQVSANAPTAAITAPNGGSFNAANVVPVTWQAADADNDSLQFALDYTPDNGQSWFLITNKLTGNSYNWTPDFVPASSQGRLRLRVSDGFNTAEVQSAPFELTAKNPLAFIYAPAEALTVTEGSLVTFEGGSLTAAGFDQGAFAWRENATVLANTRGMTQTLETVGLHVFELTVTADGLSASKSVSVTVVADYDRDGLPNSWEQAYGFNPIDPYDSNNDPDSDGLSNLLEYHQGTNPLVADTDGDSMKDGDELNVSRNPLVADSSPSGPVLQVGADQIGFLASTGGFAPEAKHFWVSNVGTGELNWNATSDAAWLQLSTTQGSAPTEVTVTADVTGMEAGEYSAQITFSAAGATNSPQVVTAKLRIVGQAGGPMIKLFLPGVSK